MKIDKISYQKMYVIGAYLNERIGIEVQLDEGECVETAFKKIKHQVDKLHIENNPHLTDEQLPDMPVTKLVTQEKPKTQEDTTIEQINEITDVKVLKAFELLAKNTEKKFPKIKEAYESRLKQLTA